MGESFTGARTSRRSAAALRSTKPRLLLIGPCVAGAASYVSLGFDTFGESLKKAYVGLVREVCLGMGGVKSREMLVRI